MDFESSHPSLSLKRLKDLSWNVKFSKGNRLLQQFVLDNSHPYPSGGENYITAVLRSMSDVPANVVNDDGYSALALAVLKNNLLMVKKLLSYLVCIDVNALLLIRSRSVKGETVLHLAAELGDSSVIQELLDHGASVNACNECHETALCYAARSGHLDAVKLLVSGGADVNLRHVSLIPQKSPLCHAIESGNVEAVKFLLSSGADACARETWTPPHRHPLHLAAELGHSSIIQELLDHGASVDACNEYHETALCYAARSGHLDAVKLLVSGGADVNPRRDSFIVQKSPLCHAIESDNVEVVKFLINSGPDASARGGWIPPLGHALHLAAELGHSSIIQELLNTGSIIDFGNEHHETALCFASRSGYLDAMRLLVSKGAAVNPRDAKKSPLSLAKRSRKLSAVVFLKNNGAVENIRDASSYLLYNTVRDGNLAAVELLVTSGAHVNGRYGAGHDTPLHEAAGCGKLEMLEFLVRNHADVNVTNRCGVTLLHLAASRENLEMVEFLLSNRADVNCADKIYETPLHFAVRWKRLECAALLLDHGADVHATNRWTPLHVAAHNGHIEMIWELLGRDANRYIRTRDWKTPLHLVRGNPTCMDALQIFRDL